MDKAVGDVAARGGSERLTALRVIWHYNLGSSFNRPAFEAAIARTSREEIKFWKFNCGGRAHSGI